MTTQTEKELADLKASLREKKDSLNDLSATNKIDVSEDLVQVSINKLVQLPSHQRLLIENRYKALQASLTEHGFIGGIFVSKETNHVIDGWYRAAYWQELGNETIPCFFIQCSEQQEKELHLRLNTQAAQFDLAEMSSAFPTLDLARDFGFSETDLTPRVKKRALEALNNIAKVQDLTKKFSATLPKSCYQKLEQIKQDNKLAEWSDVLDILIEKYYEAV